MFPLMASWESSPQDRKEFCELHELTLATFSYWRTKYLKFQRSPAELFSELQPEISGKIEITYPNGVKVCLPNNGRLSTIKALLGLNV